MLRSLVPNAPLVAAFTRNSVSTHSFKLCQLRQKHYLSVCAAAKYHCTVNRTQFSSINTRLLDPKPAVCYQPPSLEFHILQKYVSSLQPKEEWGHLNFRSSDDPTYTYVTPVSKYFYSTSNEKDAKTSTEDSTSEEAQKKMTVVQRFKAMLKDYWHVLIPVHVVTSIGWFGGFYFLATSGIDIPALMESLSFSEDFVKPFRDSSMGYYAVSYGLYKVATPARYTITVGGTSIAISFLKKRGMVQPWPINFKWLKRGGKKES